MGYLGWAWDAGGTVGAEQLERLRRLLALLEPGPKHGYDLKRSYDEQFGQDRPLAYGQVYSTLSRLLRNGMVEDEPFEPGESHIAVHRVGDPAGA